MVTTNIAQQPLQNNKQHLHDETTYYNCAYINQLKITTADILTLFSRKEYLDKETNKYITHIKTHKHIKN